MEQETKKFDLSNRLFIITALLIACILVSVVGGVFYEFKSLQQQNTNQISVSGEGKVYAKPDIAKVTLGIQTKGASVQEITQTNVTSMNKIIDAIKGLGVAEKDITTTQYYVTPEYNWTEDQGQVPNGYSISQNIEVKIRDFTKIGDVLNISTTNGANIVNSLQFTIDDPEQFKAEARAKAIIQAKEKAQKMAEQAGIKLGKVVSVYEDNYGYTPTYMDYSKAESLGAGDVAISANIQSGEQEIQMTVSVTYEIK